MKRTIALLISMLFAGMGANAQLDWSTETSGAGGGYPRMAQKADGTLLIGVDHGDGIRMSKSADGGASWSDLPTGGVAAIPDPASANEYVANVSPLVLPNGDILIACRHLNDTDTYDNAPDGTEFFDICVHRSTDGGATWSYLSSPIQHPSSPHGVGTDTNQGAWEPHLYQHSPTEIWCLYTRQAVRDSLPTFQNMKRSTDGGLTWSAEETIVGTSQFGATGHAGMASVVKAANGDLITVFETGYSTDDSMKIGMVRSTDNGSTWGSISTVYDRPGSGGYAGAPFIVKMDDDTLVVSYQHHDGSSIQTMGYVTSTDNGTTWSGNNDLFTTESWWPSLFVDATATLYGLRTGVTYKKHYPGGAPPDPDTIAYWRFEEGSDGAGATGQHTNGWNNHYTDISGNGNHMSTWGTTTDADICPVYTATVPYSPVPQTGAANDLALEVTGNDYIATHSGDGGVANKMLDTYAFTNGFTIEATFKLDVVNAWQGIVSKDGQPNAGLTQPPFRMKVTDGGALEVGFIDTNGTPFAVTVATGYLEADTWISIAATYDNSTLSVYGQKEGETGYSSLGNTTTHGHPADLGLPPRTDYPTHDPGWNIDHGWRIGWVMWNGGPTGNFMDGMVDEVRISKIPLNSSQFLASVPLPSSTVAYWRFEEGSDGTGATGQHTNGWDNYYTDVSGNANHMSTWGTTTNPDNCPTYATDTPWAAIPQLGWVNNLALDFTGNDNIATHSGDGPVVPKMLDTYAFTNGFTVEATFKLDVVNAWQGIVSKDGKPNEGSAQPAFRMKVSDAGALEVGFFDEAGTPFTATVATGYLVVDTWTSIAATYDNSTINVYGMKEGEAGYSLLATVATHGNPANLDEPPRTDYPTHDPGWNLDHGWRIGWVMWNSDPIIGNYVDGMIDEVRISNIPLATSQFLGELGVGPPEIGDIAMEVISGGTELELTWTTSDLYTYNLLKATSLSLANWTTNQTVDGGVDSVTVTTAVGGVKAFYKAESSDPK